MDTNKGSNLLKHFITSLGKVTLGNKQQAICFCWKFYHHHSGVHQQITIQGPHAWWNKQKHPNLLLSIVVNRCQAIIKARAIPIILVNTNRFNVWVKITLVSSHIILCGM